MGKTVRWINFWKEEIFIATIVVGVLITLAILIHNDSTNPKLGEANCPCCGARLVIMRDSTTETGTGIDTKGNLVTTTETHTAYHLEKKSN